MTQTATIKRFCAIEGKECEKLIEYEGTWTYFFAYPGGDSWRDFTSQLAQELTQRGFYGHRWEDIVKNDLLFSKACEGIYSHDYLLAEVTEPNPNVMLEIGYALAVGRQPILLQNKNRDKWRHNLLITMESCHYETREDILVYIAQLQAQERKIAETPDRRLPFLENMGIFDSSEMPGTVYHLKPKMSADWISRVDRTLRESYFKLSAMDPSDSVSDDFYPQAREIQRASLIVASLVSSANEGWQQHNANVALLIGFAIGLGKKVLVLQEQPLGQILDLGTVSRPIETESHAGQITQAWIQVQTESALSQTAAASRQTLAKEQVEHIRKVYLGHPDALQDHRLLEYFVPTNEFRDAMEGRRSIFIGRRGSGKSANFQAIRDELRDRKNTVTAAIAPDDFQLERISAFLSEAYAVANPQLLFRNTWHYVLLSEIARALAEDTDRLYEFPDDPVGANLYRYYQNNRTQLQLDFGNRVIFMLSSSLTPGQAADDVDETKQRTLDALRDYDVARNLRDFAKKENLTYHIIADDLDKHWQPNSKQSVDLLIGLITEADRLQRFFEGHLKVVMFLREDIYEVLTKFDEDLSKRNVLRMEWTKANLMHLVAERLAISAGEENIDDDLTWSGIFPNEVKGRPAAEYVLDIALPRPRDVLDFCQKAIDQAQRNGHSVVFEDDIIDGEVGFSEGEFWSIVTEFRGLYPGLENVLIEYAGVAQQSTWQAFRSLTSNAITKNRETIKPWVGGENIDPEGLLEVLFKVGVVGLSNTGTTGPYFANGRSFAETWNLVGPSPTVHIHPAFAKSLDVGAGATQLQGRVRKPNPGDSRQMRLAEPDESDT